MLNDFIDENWYEGVLNGVRGVVPANFVQVRNHFPHLQISTQHLIDKTTGYQRNKPKQGLQTESSELKSTLYNYVIA